MKAALTETINISDTQFFKEQRKQIQIFLDEVKIEKDKYSPEILWQIDQAIGGMGCMPPNYALKSILTHS